MTTSKYLSLDGLKSYTQSMKSYIDERVPKFIQCKASDMPSVIERGAKPADIYYNCEDGTLYVMDREGISIPLVEVEEEKLDLKTEEGFRNFDLKIEEIELPRMDLLDYIIKEIDL